MILKWSKNRHIWRISLISISFFIYCTLCNSQAAFTAPSVIAENNLKNQDLDLTLPSSRSSKKVSKPQVGYKNGFFIQSADGKYKLIIGGYAQFHFELEKEGGETTYGFRIRRARLVWKGNLFTESFTYKFQIDLVNFNTNLLLDAYVNYDILKNRLLEIRIGQQPMTYIRQHQISSTAQMFIDRSIASIEFINADDVDTDGDGVPDKLVKNGRDLGIKFHGMPFDKKLEYQVGIFNGHGTNTVNVNNDLLYMGRVVFNPLSYPGYGYEGDFEYHENLAFFIGASANYNVRNLSNDKVTSLGGETGLKFKGFAATGEFFYRNTKPGDTLLNTSNDIGYYAQAGYFVLPKRMEVALRASQIFLEGPLNDQGEFQVGINGFLYGNSLKLQTDYSYLPTNTVEGLENNQRFRLRLQTKF